MKATLITILLLMLLPLKRVDAQKFTTNRGNVSFFANAPIADVDARNDKVKFKFNRSSGELTVSIDMRDFQFKNRKMGRDARKKYIEIDKFPQASFNGKVSGDVDYNKEGSYRVKAIGKLKIHGTGKEVSPNGTIHVSKGQIRFESEFEILLADYNIKTPTILGKEMTADKVKVKVDAALGPAK